MYSTQRDKMILKYIEEHGCLSRKNAAILFFKNDKHVSETMNRLLKQIPTYENLYNLNEKLYKEKLFKHIVNKLYMKGSLWFKSCWFDNETTVIKSIDEIKFWNC